MNRFQKIETILGNIILIIAAIVVMIDPENTYEYVLYGLAIVLMLYGLRYLAFYFGMSRFMVGGKIHLFYAAIFIDLGLLTLTMADDPGMYMFWYLLIARLFAGLVDLLNGIQARKLDSPAWKSSLLQGVVNIALVILCVICVKYTGLILYIFCLGLIYSGIAKIVNTCRQNAIIYIQ